jgi:hypothetical protein
MIIEPCIEMKPNHAENLVVKKGSPTTPHKTIGLWLQIFSDILDDEQLTKELWDTLKGTLEVEGNTEESIVFNIL